MPKAPNTRASVPTVLLRATVPVVVAKQLAQRADELAVSRSGLLRALVAQELATRPAGG